MSDILFVRIFDRYAGFLELAGIHRAPEDWRFEYDPSYVQSGQALALSVSLPLREEAFAGSVVRNWFGNLLPEGAIKAAICHRLRISPDDDFAMLEAIGGECAGAVSISSELDYHPGQRLQAERLQDALQEGALDGNIAEMALAGTPWRLSLAGAQDKIAVVQDADGEIRLPASGELTTHILKPESRRLAGLRDMEALGMRLAAAIGLPVAAASLRTVAAKKVLLVERYDRVSAPGAPAVRLHQEDFCQALGCPSELKYESQGGPSRHSCLHLIKYMTPLGPVAIARFIDWVLYNILIGNADAHAKNIALLTQVDGRRRLAPYYDLVPTMAFSRKSLDRAPAMRIGDALSIDALTKANWLALVQSIESRLPYVQQRLRQMVAGIQATLPQVVAELASQGASRDLLEHAEQVITAQCWRAIEAVTG